MSSGQYDAGAKAGEKLYAFLVPDAALFDGTREEARMGKGKAAGFHSWADGFAVCRAAPGISTARRIAARISPSCRSELPSECVTIRFVFLVMTNTATARLRFSSLGAVLNLLLEGGTTNQSNLVPLLLGMIAGSVTWGFGFVMAERLR